VSLMTDPDAMRDYSRKFQGHADEIQAEATKAFASSQNISGAGWNGAAEKASFNTMTDLNQALKNIHEQMMYVSQGLSHSADTYEANEQAGAATLRNA